jgi:hypothetical protein
LRWLGRLNLLYRKVLSCGVFITLFHQHLPEALGSILLCEFLIFGDGLVDQLVRRRILDATTRQRMNRFFLGRRDPLRWQTSNAELLGSSSFVSLIQDNLLAIVQQWLIWAIHLVRNQCARTRWILIRVEGTHGALLHPQLFEQLKCPKRLSDRLGSSWEVQTYLFITSVSGNLIAPTS